jgi:beta-lactamase regulating signal transducer with metallopeptidase domain
MSGLNTLAQMAVSQLGRCLAGGFVILLIAGLFTRLLHRESSGTRFAVWFAALLAMGGIPLFAVAWSLVRTSGVAGGNHGAAEITLPSSWALYLFLAWALIAAVALTRIVAGFFQVWRLRRRSAVVNTATLAPELQETLTRFRPGREVALLLSDQIQSPTALGLLSPAIVLPTWLLNDLSTTELSTMELRQILLHELAHLRRWDDWSNLLQKIVKALFFFHPAVWWMEKKISLEREMACDEAVLAHTDNPRAYAQCLVLLAEKSFLRRSVMLAQAAVSRVGQTSLRVARILSPGARTGRPGTAGIWKLIAPSFAALLIVGLASLDRMPRLIAFESSEPAVAQAQAAPLGKPPTQSSGVVEASISRSALTSAAVQPLVIRSGNNHRSGNIQLSGNISPAAVASNLGLPVRSRSSHSSGAILDAKLDFAGHGRNVRTLEMARPCEFLVVVMESGPNNSAVQTVWQIEMWQVTVLQTGSKPIPQASPQKVI